MGSRAEFADFSSAGVTTHQLDQQTDLHAHRGFIGIIQRALNAAGMLALRLQFGAQGRLDLTRP